MKQYNFLILSILFLPFNCALADIANRDPIKVCAYLAKSGAKGNQWKNRFGQYVTGHDHSCFSENIKIGSEFLPNTIAYYVTGSAEFVDEAYLLLNVNDKKSSALAHKEAQKLSVVLFESVTGQKLPNNIARAITLGTPETIMIGKTNVIIERDNWSTGKGYSLKFLLK